jgi:hypothetical protein
MADLRGSCCIHAEIFSNLFDISNTLSKPNPNPNANATFVAMLVVSWT